MNMYSSSASAALSKLDSLTPPPPGGWFDLGCYNDSSTSRALNVTQYIQVPMTIEACTSACVQDNYTLAGLEYGGKFKHQSTLRLRLTIG
jgi:hypothetical protein